jgi:hypothetical protein
MKPNMLAREYQNMTTTRQSSTVLPSNTEKTIYTEATEEVPHMEEITEIQASPL